METQITSKNSENLKKVGTLRSRLLIFILPTVLIPLVVAVGIGDRITESRAKNQVVNELKTDTLLAGKTVTTFIHEAFEVTDLVANDPKVIELIKAGNNQSQEQKLAQQSLEELEKKFAATKLLTVDDTVNEYLKRVANSSLIGQILITERNGFNIAQSKPASNFVQRDKDWWQITQQEGQNINYSEFDKSMKANVFAFSEAIKDPQTGEFLGVIKANIPVSILENNIDAYLYGDHKQDYQFQIVNPHTASVVDVINHRYDEVDTQGEQGIDLAQVEIVGGEPIVEVAKTLTEVLKKSFSVEEAQKLISQRAGFSEVSLEEEKIFSQTSVTAVLKYQNKIYSLSTIPNSQLVSIGVVDYQLIAAEGHHLLVVFGLTGLILGIASVGVVIFLAQQITNPLTNLSATTQKAAEGDLDVKASLEGTLETRILADSFNNLVGQVKESLQTQQNLANEQRQQREQLEAAIYTLIDEVSSATEGDLTVRANLDSMELSTVADLFNAIIDNLEEIAVEAKQSTSQVGSSLKQNEAAILSLAEQAIAEAKETRDTLMSVEQMSRSIQAVAENASQAEQIVEDTYNTIVSSTNNMDLTVDSILGLRTTVGETAKKMKRLGESSQKISQAVSFIEEIALRTNILAINASVEAGRAGEYGQGFTIVAEQVAALAEQSAAATKEIASIVTAIQAETQEVNHAMESGTAQVVETTRLVEATKESLRLVLEKSREINQLMQSISQTTVSQAHTSQNVTSLMQKIANLSETTSISSKEVAQSIVETAQVAQKLESAVAQFKVAELS